MEAKSKVGVPLGSLLEDADGCHGCAALWKVLAGLNSLLPMWLAEHDHQMPGRHWVTSLACLWF